MPRKKERGRPMGRPYPPRINASAKRIANVVLNARSPARFGSEPKRKVYRCRDCAREVAYPETLYEGDRCESCHAPVA